MHSAVSQHLPAIAVLCRRHGVRRLEVFGSAARGTDFDRQDSDADFLVEFDPSLDGPSLAEFFDLQEELSRLLGRKVDLAEAPAIRNPYIRADIDASREVVYAS